MSPESDQNQFILQINGNGYRPVPNHPTNPLEDLNRHRRYRCCNAIKITALLLALTLAVAVLVDVCSLFLRKKKNPIKIKAFAADATVTEFQFDSADSGELSYNVSLYLFLRNSNNKVSLHYDWMHAGAYYKGKKFGWAMQPGFYQAPTSSVTVHPVFEGRTPVLLSGEELQEFMKEKRAGFFDMEFSFSAWIRYWVESLQTWNHAVIGITCKLNGVGFESNDFSSGHQYKGSRCKVE